MGLPPYSPLLAETAYRQLVLPLATWLLLYALTRWFDFDTLGPPRRQPAPWISATVLYFLLGIGHQALRRSSRPHAPNDGKPISAIPSNSWLNLDVLREWLTEGKTEYLGDGMICRLSKRFPTPTRTFNTNILGERSIVTLSPKHAHAILTSPLSPNIFQKGDKFRERAVSLFGNGIFGSDGEQWKASRTRLRPFFAESAKERRNTSSMPTLSARGEHLAQLLADLPKGSEAFDAQALFRKYTMSMTLGSLFGMATADHNDSAITAFAEAFEQAQAVLSRRIRIGTFWALFELSGDRMVAPMKTIRAFVGPLVDAAIRAREERSGASRTLLDHLVSMISDRKTIEDEVINILIAARDTTASALSSCMYCLAMYPQLQRDLADSLIAEAGGSSQQNPLLKAFIHEVLRLLPPVPLNIRRSTTWAKLPPDQPGDDDLLFPPGTSVILATLIIQRDPELWGASAEQFLPSRWIDDGGRFSMPKAAVTGFQAFNLGPRTCLGQGFALEQIGETLVALLRDLHDKSCRLQLSTQPEKMNVPVPPGWKGLPGRGASEQCWFESDVVLSYKGGLWVQIVQHDKGKGPTQL